MQWFKKLTSLPSQQPSYEKWTQEEIDKLFSLAKQFGNVWTKIQQEYFPFRSTKSLKTKYFTELKIMNQQLEKQSKINPQDDHGQKNDVNIDPVVKFLDKYNQKSNTNPKIPKQEQIPPVLVKLEDGCIVLPDKSQEAPKRSIE